MQFDFEDLLSMTIESKYFKEPYAISHNGKMIPRVTAILSRMLEDPSIAQWANSLGFKHLSYSKELDQICKIGTTVHEQINQFLSSNTRPDANNITFGFLAFLEWYNQVSQLNLEILGLEEHMMNDYYSGTYDALLKIDNKIWLIDFKTSNKVNFKYFLQLAAYRKLLKETKNIDVDGCMILQLSKYHPSFLEFVADLHYPPHQEYMNIAERTFDALLYSFYNAMYLEGSFKHEWPHNPKYLSQKK